MAISLLSDSTKIECLLTNDSAALTYRRGDDTQHNSPTDPPTRNLFYRIPTQPNPTQPNPILVVLRVKEEAERAAMGSEEVSSIRAGLAPRTKRQGQDQTLRLNKAGGRRRQSGVGGGWRKPKQGGRGVETQRNRGDHKKGLLATLNSKGPLHGSHAEAAAVRSGLNTAVSDERSGGAKPNRGDGTLDKTDPSAPTRIVGSGTRSIPFSSVTKAGVSTIGIGSTGRGDGGLGCEVYAAAAESAEVFLEDFLPTVSGQQPPLSAVTAAQEKSAAPVSRWAAIGQGGRLSTRAATMCAAKDVRGSRRMLRHFFIPPEPPSSLANLYTSDQGYTRGDVTTVL